MRRLVPLCLKAAVSLGLIALLLRFTDIEAIWRSLSQARPSLLLLVVTVSLCSVVLSSYKWQVLLPGNIDCSLWWLIRLYLIGIFFNNFLPTSIGGDAARGYMVTRRYGRKGEVLMSIFIERLTGLLALLLFFLCGLYLAEDSRHLVGMSFAQGVILVAFGVLFLSVFLLLQRQMSQLLPERLKVGVQSLVGAFSHCAGGRRTVFALTWSSLLFQLMAVGVYFLAGRSLGVQVSYPEWMIIFAVVTLMTLIPFSLNGLGIREGGVVYFLSRLGVDAAMALSLSLLVYVLTLLLSVIGFFFFMHGRRIGEGEK